MMTNLFSTFDPACNNNMALNWLSMFIFISIPVIFWIKPTRTLISFSLFPKFLLNEFNPLVKKSPYTLVMILSLFIMVSMNNFFGLFPFIFTASAHMIFGFSLALPAWLASIMSGWKFNTLKLLAHQIPKGTPLILMPLMVLIEFTSNIIRPLTLAIRLTANMVAGHLLLILLMSATPNCSLMHIPLLMIFQTLLTLLELAVAFIQAYVFSALISLYNTELTS